jgi:S-adenosylmethionine decarboxylase
MNGIEWIVEAHGCSPDSLRELAALRALFDEIIRELDLRPIGETNWHQFPGTGGVTGLCLLSESHLACHTFPEFGSLCLNVFCCRPRADWDFDANLKRMFSASSVCVRRMLRPYVSPNQETLQERAERILNLARGGARR